jgi:hypothetical protein
VKLLISSVGADGVCEQLELEAQGVCDAGRHQGQVVIVILLYFVLQGLI